MSFFRKDAKTDVHIFWGCVILLRTLYGKPPLICSAKALDGKQWWTIMVDCPLYLTPINTL